MTAPSYYGLTVPFPGTRLVNQPQLLDAATRAGFTDLWSSEVNEYDAFTPLAAAAITHPHFRLGTAIVPAYTRSPALLAMSAASLADLQPRQVLLGIGASSNVIVESWNGVPFEEPYRRVRDVATFLTRAFVEDKVDMTCDSFTIRGFRLGVRPAITPKVLIAALRPGMLKLAGRISDGAILNWLSPADVTTVVGHVLEGRASTSDRIDPPEIVARLFVIPSSDLELVRQHAKRLIASYLTVPVYAAFQTFLGRQPRLQPVWDSWAAGDRKSALAHVDNDLVDELFIHGTPAACRRQIQAYVAAGVTAPMVSVSVLDDRDPVDVIADLALVPPT